MRIAGVRLDGDSVAWIDVGDARISELDRVTVQVADGSSAEGEVFVAPEHLIRSIEPVDGRLTEVLPRRTEGERDTVLPGSEMPPLGTHVTAPNIEGVVTGIDAVHCRVTVTADGGGTETVDLVEIVATAGAGA